MKRNVSWLAVTLVSIMALGVVLLAGVRSAVRRAFDLAEYKAASPYYQSLALREQVIGNQRHDTLLWVIGGILAVILAGWFISLATPLLKEARLGYKAIRPRRTPTRRSAPAAGPYTSLPPAPGLRALPRADEFADENNEPPVDVWSGGR